jgi:hypothetical protein
VKRVYKKDEFTISLCQAKSVSDEVCGGRGEEIEGLLRGTQ